MNAQYKITYGGWYQRTTLHLSEVYEFFSHANSYLNLDKEKLKQLHTALKLKTISREVSYLEYVKATTEDGIEIRYYEDGLYVMELLSEDIEAAKITLEKYFNEILNPALSYIFSLGAPTPKILANIKTTHPTVVSIGVKDKVTNDSHPFDLKNVYSHIEEKNISVYKSSDYIFIMFDLATYSRVNEIIEMQIFFREFKDQLEKYLNIHRRVWEEISTIRDRKYIRAKEVIKLRDNLDSYQKTINLISNRINQMGSYVKTRKDISKNLEIDEHIERLFQYRFDVLLNTLDYIKEVWRMTIDYVNSAIQILVEVQNLATNKSIQSLTLITSVGVLAGLITHLSRDTYPKVTTTGLLYLGSLILAGLVFNFIVQKVQLNRLQKLKFTKNTDAI